MDKIELSRHIIKDRMERMVKIATTVGFGEVVKIFITDGKYGKVRQCLTTTGIIIIKEPDSERIITAYAIKMDRLIAMYRNDGNNERVPQKIYLTVLNNEKKRKWLFEM